MNRIRELRKQEKMTQKELANHLQIADSTLSYWEMGKYEPDNDSLRKLSKFFLVPIDYILGGDIADWEIINDKVLYAETTKSILSDAASAVSDTIVAYESNDHRNAQEAFNRSEFHGLMQEEIDRLAEYAEFIKSRRAKRKLGN